MMHTLLMILLPLSVPDVPDEVAVKSRNAINEVILMTHNYKIPEPIIKAANQFEHDFRAYSDQLRADYLELYLTRGAVYLHAGSCRLALADFKRARPLEVELDARVPRVPALEKKATACISAKVKTALIATSAVLVAGAIAGGIIGGIATTAPKPPIGDPVPLHWTLSLTLPF